jgi:hypothetical protein
MKDEDLSLEFKGVWIPAAIWLNKDISLQEKMLLVKIDSFKECFASNQYLADFMCLSVPRVKSILGNLRKLEFITSHEERKGNLTIKRTLYVDPIKFHGIARIENDTKVVLDPIRGRTGSDTHSNTVSNKDKKEIKTCKPTVDQHYYSIRVVFNFWKAVMIKSDATKLDGKRSTAIKNRLRDGYTVDQIKQAIDKCSLTPHNMGQNNQGQKYNDIELICRNASNLERFIESTPGQTGQQVAINNNQSFDDALKRTF